MDPSFLSIVLLLIFLILLLIVVVFIAKDCTEIKNVENPEIELIEYIPKSYRYNYKSVISI